jgi:hypothetical protein
VTGRKSIAGVVLMALGLVLGGLYIGLVEHYCNTLPREPRPEIGRTYEMSNHGTVVYLTKEEHSGLDVISFVALALGVTGGLLWARKT